MKVSKTIERAKKLITQHLGLPLTDPDVLAATMNVGFVWHSANWAKGLNHDNNCSDLRVAIEKSKPGSTETAPVSGMANLDEKSK